MNTARKTQSKEAKIVRLRPTHNQAKRYAKAAFIVTHSSLWNNVSFSKKEIAHLNELMMDHFEGSDSLRKTFIEITERICLAKRYLSRQKGRYIAKPVDWLNVFYYNGLTGTAEWLEIVKQQRKTCPEYNKGIRIFANAVLALIENPNPSQLKKYRETLIKNRQFDLVQAYANTLLNLQIH